MTIAITITLCVLILLAYAFDLSSKFTKIPTVIFLLIMGAILQKVSVYLAIDLPDLKPILPVLGTVGLILIVLEGGLDLEINRSKVGLLKKAALSASFPMLVLLFLLSYAFFYLSGNSVVNSILNAIPFCVISSAIAIPSVHNISSSNREFVIYESSFSDIIGVILFNFFVASEIINTHSFTEFFFHLLLMFAISFVASIGLAFLIKKIDHHVKFVPILMVIILIYFISKIYHLPALIFILIFGLFLNNLDELRNKPLIKPLEPEKLDLEVRRFKEIVIEFTFLIRTVFFLLFGFLINLESLLNTDSLRIAAAIVVCILLIRYLQLKIFNISLSPLLWVAPRGLITVLLFLSIPLHRKIPFVNESLVIQVVLLSVLVMMFGMMFHKPQNSTENISHESNKLE
jgi:cell volume regulation protein A